MLADVLDERDELRAVGDYLQAQARRAVCWARSDDPRSVEADQALRDLEHAIEKWERLRAAEKPRETRGPALERLDAQAFRERLSAGARTAHIASEERR